MKSQRSDDHVLKCPSCSTDYPDGHYGTYCDICGENIRADRCPSCGNILDQHPTKAGVLYWCGTCRSTTMPKNTCPPAPAFRCFDCKAKVLQYNVKTSNPFFWCAKCKENKENALLEDG